MDNSSLGFGSVLDNIINAMAGRGYADGSTWLQRPQTMPDGPPMPAAAPMQRPGAAMGHPAPQTHPMHPTHPPMPPQAQMPQQPPQFAGWSPMNSQPGMPTGSFAPPPPSQMAGRMIPPSDSGYSGGAPIQQPMPGAQPALGSGFHPANLGMVDPNQMQPQGLIGLRHFAGLGHQPSLVNMMLAGLRR